jgi:hypothetical protein
MIRSYAYLRDMLVNVGPAPDNEVSFLFGEFWRVILSLVGGGGSSEQSHFTPSGGLFVSLVARRFVVGSATSVAALLTAFIAAADNGVLLL